MSEEELHSSSDKDDGEEQELEGYELKYNLRSRETPRTPAMDVRAAIARFDEAIERCRTLTSAATRSSVDVISPMGREVTVTGSVTPASMRLVPISLRSGRRREDGDKQELAGRVQTIEWTRRAVDASDEPDFHLDPHPLLVGGHDPYAGRLDPETRKCETARGVERSLWTGQNQTAGSRRAGQNSHNIL